MLSRHAARSVRRQGVGCMQCIRFALVATFPGGARRACCRIAVVPPVAALTRVLMRFRLGALSASALWMKRRGANLGQGGPARAFGHNDDPAGGQRSSSSSYSADTREVIVEDDRRG
jgi:hypothetical protein